MFLIDQRKGFTLIEMLVVMVIIGVMAIALVPRLRDAQGRARDAQRKTDLKSIANVLMLYQADQGKFAMPAQTTATNGAGYSRNCWAGANITVWMCTIMSYNLTTTVEAIIANRWLQHLYTGNYLDSVPYDPLNTTNGVSVSSTSNRGAWYNANFFAYGYTASAQSFTLHARLENKTDKERCKQTNDVIYTNTSGVKFNCYNTTSRNSIGGFSTTAALVEDLYTISMVGY